MKASANTIRIDRAVLAAAVLAVGLALHGAPASAGEELIVVERATSDAVTDLGEKGDSVGDVLTFSNELYDKDNKTVVGRDNGWCVRTVAGQAWECFWTATFEKGQITVEGPYYDTKDSVLSVTGGTGDYSKTQGQMKLHARDQKGTEYDFVYILEE
jgi:allene oxide cyclase